MTFRIFNKTTSQSRDHEDPRRKSRLFKQKFRLLFLLLMAVLILIISAPRFVAADEGPITKLKFKNTTNPDNKPDCGDGWKRYHQNLNAGGLATGDTWSTEPAVYLCYKTGAVADAITHLYPISSTGDLGRSTCYGDDQLVENEKGTWTNINREGWKVQKDRLCYGKDGDYPLLDFQIKTTVGVPDDFEYRQPNVNPKTGNGGTGQTFNFGGTLLYLFTQDRSTVAHDYDCGGEGEKPCLITTEFWWTNGNGACDRGLREKDGKCKNGLSPFQRHHDEVEDFQNGTDDGDWILWALDNQRTNLAIDEPLNWVMNLYTHNAYNNHADGYVVDPNHKYSITDQLNLGSRRLMIDVHDYNGEVRLCHGQSDGTGCASDDRLYFNIIKELGAWLDENPGEFVQVQFEEYLKSSDAETVNFPIDEYIGASRVYRHEDYASVLTECINGSKGCTSADAHRWPSLAELRKAGKQAMFSGGLNDFGSEFFTSKPDETGGTADAFFGGVSETDHYEVAPYDDDLANTVNCLDTPLWDDDLDLTEVREDRTEIGVFVDDWPGVLNADRVKTLARCNMGINFDFINSQSATSTSAIGPCVLALINGLVDVCVDPDDRLEAAVWSWRKGDMGDNGTHAKLANSDKRWVSTDKDNEYHFACAKKRDKDDLTTLGDTAGSAWFVTDAIGPWEDGVFACEEEFGTDFVFSVPVNGWQNEKLKEALKDAKDSNSYDESSDDVWLNYRRGSKDGEHFWVKGRSLDFASITAVTPSLEGLPAVFFNSGRGFGIGSDGIYWLEHKWELRDIANNTTITLLETAAGFLPAFHTFEDSGSYEIILTIKDPAGQTGIARSTFTVGNFKPTAAFTGSSSVLEGSDATVQFDDPFDLSPADVAAGFTYSYDFDGTRFFKAEPGFSQVISPTVAVPGHYLDDNGRTGDDPFYHTVKARIYDKDGDFTAYEWDIEIQNVDPTAVFGSQAITGTQTAAAPATISIQQGRIAKQTSRDTISTSTAVSSPGVDEGTSIPLFANPVDSAVDLSEGLRSYYFGNLRGQEITDNPDPGLTGTLSFDCAGYTNPDPGARPGFVQYANGVDLANSSCTFVDGPAEQDVTAWLIDKDEGYTEYNDTITVLNVAPTVQTPLLSPPSPDEGSTVSTSAVFTDPGVLDAPFTCTVNYGDGSGDIAGTVSIAESLLKVSATCTGPDHVYADNGSYTVTITVDDKDHSATVNGQGSSSTLVTVNNVDPILTLSGDTIDENGTATVNGTITDPGSQDTFEVEIDWGEGPKETYKYGAGTTNFSVSHQYLDDNPGGTPSDSYTVKGTVTDNSGGSGTDNTTVTVNNVNPIASISSILDEAGGSIGIDVPVALIHTEVDLVGSFTDVGSQDEHTAFINWGDGNSVSLGGTTGSVNASHVFAQPGSYSIQLDVTDDDTGVGFTTAAITVVDASGATSVAIDLLKAEAAKPGLDPAAVEAIGDALVELDGSNGGKANNGALDMLAKGNLNAALVKIRKAIMALETAEAADTSLDLTSLKSLLTLTAKSTALDAIMEAEAAASNLDEIALVENAYALIDAADDLLASSNYVGAVEAYRSALQEVEGIVG